MSDPEEVTVIVHGARGLKGKKPGRHKFSVIFGLGGTKFRTDILKEAEGNPDWNEETLVDVENILDQVFFIVTEKDDILGQVNIPVTSIRSTKGVAKRVPLQPHKKCPKPQGELIYQCYVSKYKQEQIQVPSGHAPVIKMQQRAAQDGRPPSAFQRLKQRMASPVTQRKQRKEVSIKEHKGSTGGSLGKSTFNKKFSRSIQDLFSFGKMSAGETIDIDSKDPQGGTMKKEKSPRRFSLAFLSVSNNLDQAGEDPEILSVTPNTGPIDQPKRLCIEGRNLGMGKSDIMSLKVCGCDCTDTLEYDSATRVYCTTHFWKVGCGSVIIDTVSGGIGTLKNAYTFYDEPLDANGNNNSTNPFENDQEETTEDFHVNIGGREIKSGSNTLPRIRTSGINQTHSATSSPVNTTPTGRYKKNHVRQNSETVVPSQPNSVERKQPNVEHISKEELQAKVMSLEDQNARLKKDNVAMRGYIDNLVAKCMIHCPEALAMEEDEKTKLFVL